MAERIPPRVRAQSVRASKEQIRAARRVEKEARWNLVRRLLCKQVSSDRGVGVRVLVELQRRRPAVHMRIDHAQHDGLPVWLTAAATHADHLELLRGDLPLAFARLQPIDLPLVSVTDDQSTPAVLARGFRDSEPEEIAAAVLLLIRKLPTSPARVLVGSGHPLAKAPPAASPTSTKRIRMVTQARRSGDVRCAVCDHPLEDEVSRQLGIGPECLKRVDPKSLALLRSAVGIQGRGTPTTMTQRWRALIDAEYAELLVATDPR